MIRIEFENGEVVKCNLDGRRKLVIYDTSSDKHLETLQQREPRVRTVICYNASDSSGPFYLTKMVRNIPYVVDSSNIPISPQIWKGKIAQFIVDNLSEIHIPED